MTIVTFTWTDTIIPLVIITLQKGVAQTHLQLVFPYSQTNSQGIGKKTSDNLEKQNMAAGESLNHDKNEQTP